MTLKYDHQPIGEWLEEINAGKIALPRFQRSYVWTDKQVTELIYALLSERPVGSLLLVEHNGSEGNFAPRSFFEVHGNGEKEELENCEKLVLDGQQRLTSLWRALKPKDSEQYYFIKVKDWADDKLEMEKLEDDVPIYREKKASRMVKDPELAKENNLCPVWILGLDLVTQEEDALHTWCLKACKDKGTEARKLWRKIGQNFAEKLRNRSLWFMNLPKEVSREEAIDIYIKTNKSSAIIKSFDIAVAEYDREGESLRDEILSWASQISAVERFFGEDEQKMVSGVGEMILKIACLKNGITPTEKNYISLSVISHLRDPDNFSLIKDGLEWAFNLFGEKKIWYRKHLPSYIPLQVLPALHCQYKNIKNADHEGLARDLIHKYVWRAFSSDRYGRTANTKLREDYAQLFEALGSIAECGGDVLASKKPNIPIFKDDVTLPTKDRLCDFHDPIKPPTSRDSLAKSLSVIGLQNGAEDFATGEKISKTTIFNREQHHLFPRSFLHGNGLSKTEISHGLNFALVGAKTNKKLAAKSPIEYLKERYAHNKLLKEKDMRKRLESHMIPYDSLKDAGTQNVKANYRKFIEVRAGMYADEIKQLTEWPFK